MNRIELLRHVANNLEAGRAAGSGLHYNGHNSNAPRIYHIQWDAFDIYTLAAHTHKVNNYTVPAPESKEPSAGVRYYISATSSRDFTRTFVWDGGPYCLLMLTRKVLFLTKEAAQQNTLALLGLDPDLGVEGV
jgi:hypothetical protein